MATPAEVPWVSDFNGLNWRTASRALVESKRLFDGVANCRPPPSGDPPNESPGAAGTATGTEANQSQAPQISRSTEASQDSISSDNGSSHSSQGAYVVNGGGEMLLIPEEELRKVGGASNPSCEHCDEPFKPRKGKGGKPQRFCSPECRTAFNNSNRLSRHCDELGRPDDLLAPAPGSPAARHLRLDPDAFRWDVDEDVVLHDQRATAIYHNERDDIVIRQERAWDEDDDVFVIIRRENIQAFLDKLCGACGIPGVGGG